MWGADAYPSPQTIAKSVCKRETERVRIGNLGFPRICGLEFISEVCHRDLALCQVRPARSSELDSGEERVGLSALPRTRHTNRLNRFAEYGLVGQRVLAKARSHPMMSTQYLGLCHERGGARRTRVGAQSAAHAPASLVGVLGSGGGSTAMRASPTTGGSARGPQRR